VSISVRSETAPPAIRSTLAVARPSLRSSLLILLAALLLMAPELTIGMTVTDNYRFNLLWPEQFGDLLRNGSPYPRWLPHAWKGLGTPAFYFYPPVFFWVTGAVDALTGGTLS